MDAKATGNDSAGNDAMDAASGTGKQKQLTASGEPGEFTDARAAGNDSAREGAIDAVSGTGIKNYV